MAVRINGHTVLASADSESYTSLRRRPTSREERYAMGKALRRQVPRKSLGALEGARRPPRSGEADHRSPTGAGCRALIPVRVGRMVTSPYSFLRGTAVVMADDVAAAAGHRHHAGGLRRLAPGQLRLLRLARGRAGDRPERLRRGPSRVAGSGTCAGWWPASGWRAGRTARARPVRGPRCWPASRPTATRSASWPSSRC